MWQTWKPVDHGYGAIYKRLIGQIQDKWLEIDENIDLWLTGKYRKEFTVSNCRTIITHWVSAAYERLQSEEYINTCVIPKPLPDQVAEEAIECLVPEPAPESDCIVVNDL